MDNKIPFSPPYIDSDVIAEVVDSLQSGWITTGPKVKALESEVAAMIGIDHVLCVNSWTSGAILVLKWFGVGPGDEVIIPAYSYAATALAVLHCGAVPVMVDVEEDFTVSASAIKAAITEKTKAIIPVDIAGLPCDYEPIMELVNQKEVQEKFHPTSENQKKLGRILVLADAAHSFGAFYNGRSVGACADITVFSFHAVKNVTTAEGGAICITLPEPFDQAEVYKIMRLWTLNGQTKDAFTKSQAGGSAWRYDIIFPGLKINMADINAAIGLGQLRKYQSTLIPARKKIARQYAAFFEKKNWAYLPIMEDEKRISSYHLFPLRIAGASEIQRDAIIDEIASRGIAVNVHFIPMPMLTLFKSLGYNIENYPVAYNNFANEISLPLYPQLSDNDVERICAAVEDAVKHILKK